MKAVRKLIILAMACVFLCTQGIAVSEAAPTVPPLRHILDIDVSVSPDALVTGGDVQLTFTVKNDSEYTASGLYLKSADGHHSEMLGRLGPGEMQTYSRTYTVSEEELDAGSLSFVISHDDIVSSGGEPVVYEVNVPVSRTLPMADIEFTRQISNAQVISGATVMLTYRVVNTGNVPLENVKVQDKLGNYTGQADVLSPGETRIFTCSVTVEEDVRSEAKVTYSAPGVNEESVTIKLDNVEIMVVEPAVSVGLTLDRQSASYGDTVNGVVTIAAAGADISDITVYDDVNNTVIADTIEVNAGNTATITCSWPVRGLTDYRVRIEGINTAGQKVEGFSNTVELGLDGEFSESSLNISANAQTPRINKKGKVRISIAIINDGNVAARDVILTEATLGELRRFEFVPAGEPTVSSIIVDVKDDTDYVFAVAYEQAGESVTVQSEPVSVVIASDGEDPVSEKDEDNAGEVYEISSPSRYYWMLAAGGFVLIVLIILLIVSHDRERREKKLRRELGKQRRLESEKTKHK